MSHETKVTTVMRDAGVLREACEALGLRLEENGQQRQFGGRSVRAPLVVKCKGPYDIAATKDADGTYTLSTDWWSGHVAKEVGQDFTKLTQQYNIANAKKTVVAQAKAKGFTAQWTVNQTTGQPRLQLRKMTV